MTLRKLLLWMLIICVMTTPILALSESEGDSGSQTESSTEKDTKPETTKETTPKTQPETKTETPTETKTETPTDTKNDGGSSNEPVDSGSDNSSTGGSSDSSAGTNNNDSTDNNSESESGSQETDTPSGGSEEDSGEKSDKPTEGTDSGSSDGSSSDENGEQGNKEGSSNTDSDAQQQGSEKDEPGSPATDTDEPEEPESDPVETGKVTIQVVGNAVQADGIWTIELTDPAKGPSFTWSCSVDNEGYLVKIGDTSLIDSASSDTSITLSANSYSMDGVNVLSVGAVFEDGSVEWSTLKFKISMGKGEFPGGFPGGGFPGGGFSGKGGMSGMSGMSGMGEEEQGFRVTPGVALTSSHANGEKVLTIFGAVSIEQDIPITSIEQTDMGVLLTLDSEKSFFAESSEGVLRVVPETDGDCWQMNAVMLKALKRSSIDRIIFVLDGSEYTLETDFTLDGDIWGTLRSKGIVAGDCTLIITGDGLTAVILGTTYLVDAEGRLSTVNA